jgi:hypothetical protein
LPSSVFTETSVPIVLQLVPTIGPRVPLLLKTRQTDKDGGVCHSRAWERSRTTKEEEKYKQGETEMKIGRNYDRVRERMKWREEREEKQPNVSIE